ncbi:hypothetical protein [Cellulosimicrobium cellulans]|uniref:hypothetical protein n=1 Tax=Cellulosimicrobium cellulans TaxID=1710 RepID=UPI00240652AB|nr:hypothetical protein [Cellulosimicrobium cellulans]MDF9878797.1 hypothetical protein [Cellulosimicrobium cellulans]
MALAFNTILIAKNVPEEVRAAYFGHDAAVNRDHYTNLGDTTVLIAAAARIFGEASGLVTAVKQLGRRVPSSALSQPASSKEHPREYPERR